MSARFAVALCALAGLAAACGGSDHDEKTQPTSAAGNASTVPPLPARTAGKACTADTECGNGACVKQLPDMTGNGFFGGDSMIAAPGGYCTTGCKVSADCGEGGACVSSQQNALTGFLGGAAGSGSNGTAAGSCYASCKDASECREGYRCISTFGLPITTATGGSGTCQVAPATDKLADAVVGSMCGTDADCAGGSCMTGATDGFGQSTSTYAGGYCTGRCLQDGDCGATGVCAGAVAGGTGTCYRKCTGDADCGRDGYRCRDGANLGSSTMMCVPGVKPLADGVVGQACTDDAACGSAAKSCKTQLTSQFSGQTTALPGGYCSQSCVDDSDCGAGGSCSGSFSGVVSGTCFKVCSAATDCREGYTCGAAPNSFSRGMMGATSAPTVCAPIPPANTSDQDAGTP